MRLALLLLVGCAPPPECALGDEPLGALTAWERALVEGPGLPAAPEPAFLPGEEGLGLAHRTWKPDGWDGTGAAVVFVPGSTAHSELYAVLGQGLASRGVLARIIDVRGHGLSACAGPSDCADPAFADRTVPDDERYYPGRMGDSRDANQIVRDLGAHLEALRSAWPAASVHLGGHSSGAGVVSRYVEHAGASGISSAALLAPYHHADQPQVRPEVVLDCADTVGTDYARVDLGALGAALRGAVHRYVISFHKGAELTEPLDALAYTWTTLEGMATTDPDAFWSAWTVPVLLVAAEEDHLLDPDGSERELRKAAGGGQFALIGDTSHVGLSWSDEVAAVLAEWFAQ